MPGDAFTSLLLNPQLPPDAYEKTIALYGLDRPLSERVIKYVQNFFKVHKIKSSLPILSAPVQKLDFLTNILVSC